MTLGPSIPFGRPPWLTISPSTSSTPATCRGPAEYRAERARAQADARLIYRDRLAPILDSLRDTDALRAADVVLDALFVPTTPHSAKPCSCSCHPHLPDGTLHDHGRSCPCRLSPEERRAQWESWDAERDAFWESPEGLAITAQREADGAELAVWIDDDVGVVIDRHGGMCPEQWEGTVDGHSFYFRERHDDWRIELDLRPTGRQMKAWTGNDVDGDNFELHDVTAGDIIAEGTIGASGYGSTPAQRAQFIVTTIRSHLARETCLVHADRAGLGDAIGIRARWCPVCGAALE